MNIILNTQDELEFTINILHRMTVKDYDLEEMLNLIFTSLIFTSRRDHTKYNDGLAELMRDGDDEDTKIYNKAMEYLYKAIYATLLQSGAYNEDGFLEVETFRLVDLDIAIFKEYVPEPPTT